MKAYVLNDIGKLDDMEIPRPTIKTGEVLLRVRAAGICGSDIPRIFVNGTYHFPTIPGHEFAGDVVETVGNSPWLGKRVGVFPLIPCMECESCKNQQYEMCEHYNYLGSRTDGGFAEYVVVPEWNLIELPDRVSFEEAAMLEPASVALHALRQVDLSKVQSVALFGLGTIGSLVAQWLKVFGISDVYATGHGAENGQMLREICGEGNHYFDTSVCSEDDVIQRILEDTQNRAVDLVIDCVNSSRTIADALQVVRRGGQILEIGNPGSDVTVERNVYWQLLRKQITVHGTWNSGFTHSEEDDWHLVLKAIEEDKLYLKELITHQFDLEHLPEGLDIMRSKREYHNKVMICN